MKSPGSSPHTPATDAPRGSRPRDAGVLSRAVWRLVAVREVSVKLRDRNFLVSTALMLVLVVAVIGVQVVVAGHGNAKKIAVTGVAGAELVQSAQQLAVSAGSDVKLTVERVSSDPQVRQRVSAGSVAAGLVRVGGGWELIGKSGRDADLSSYIGQAVRTDAVQRNAKAAGTSIAALSRGADLTYDLLQPKNDKDRLTAKIGGVVFGGLFYLAALLFGMAIANSVVEEKQNRIVEIIASAIPLRQLLIGKILGNTFLALCQVVLLALVGVGGLLVTGNADLLGELGPGIGWFLPFFLIGFLALAALWAVVGAMATRSEDVQSTSAPMTALVAIVFFAGILATGTLQQIASFAPVFSTIAMPARVLSGTASWWEPLVSLVIAIAGGYGILRVAERMYRRALLQTSHKLTLRQVLRADSE